MKTITLSLVSYAISFFAGFTSKSKNSIDQEALRKALVYKEQNGVACGTGTRGEQFFSYAFLNPQAWNYFYESSAAYNTLSIPDTLSGTDFSLRMHDTTKQYFNGLVTGTSAFNNNDILGPTLIFTKGSAVRMHVKNELRDTTTVHWHGMHLPAVMDGGPHQVVAPGAEWDPSWIVKNEAATYWYHPHLHMKTSQQLIQGLAGMIIVRDEKEGALPLPRSYGITDIPLILNEKRFDAATNQLTVSRYGDTMMCNGTLNAQYNVPAQVIRFRVLNAAVERVYNLGLSNNQTFYVIASDAGLLDKPVPVTRYILAPGERIEILVNFSPQQGQVVTLRAFNASLPSGIAGSEPDNGSTPPILRNRLGKRDFNILRLNITTKIPDAITTIPSTLVQNETIDSTQAAVTRTIRISQAGNAAWFNNQFFDMQRVDYEVQQDDTEIWEITNNGIVAHPFHIHDVSFKILSKTDGPVQAFEKGWKDVILVRKGATVRFIAKFSDYADAVHPFMFHCHMTFHEDEGLMGQFVVMPPSSALPAISVTGKKLTEGNDGTQQIKFTVTLSSPFTQNVSVTYKTKDATAIAPGDYATTTGTLDFAPGETIKNITVPLKGDTDIESDETFKLTLSKPVNATLVKTSVTGTILNDDIATLAENDNSSVTAKLSTGIKIFPNPITNNMLQVTIDPVYALTLRLVLYDAAGRVAIMQMVATNTGAIKLDVSTLTNGVYFLVLTSGTKTIVRKQVNVLH